MTINTLEKLMDKNKTVEDKIKNFQTLLESLEEIDQKKKLLWKEIYKNAVSDRERASILFTEAYKTMGAAATDHVTLGTTMTKYIERMCKSNEQILKLAELISKSEQASASVDPDELFKKISE